MESVPILNQSFDNHFSLYSRAVFQKQESFVAMFHMVMVELVNIASILVVAVTPVV